MTMSGKYVHRAERIRNMRRAKRRQAICRTCILCLMTLLFIAGLAVSTHSFNASAQSSVQKPVLYKYYKNVVIHSDDTLWSLAQENYLSDKQTMVEYIAEVQRINHLDDDQIVTGTHIVLPYYSTEFIYYTSNE